jgi:hypothetical protein
MQKSKPKPDKPRVFDGRLIRSAKADGAHEIVFPDGTVVRLTPPEKDKQPQKAEDAEPEMTDWPTFKRARDLAGASSRSARP